MAYRRDLTIEDDEILVSFDVKSLFTNIPRDLVIATVKDEWKNVSAFTSIPQVLFLEIIDLVIKSGYFRFQGKFYEQIQGLPMGNPLSPCLADLVMNRILDTACKKLTHKPKIILKYVDDLFLIVKKNEIDHTLDIFNNIHKLIQFTCERERDGCLPYLDVLVKRKESGTINTNWYSKPIASGRIMNFNSLHPLSQKVNTAMGLIHRVTTLTTDTDFNTTTTITDILKKNGYPRQTIGRIMRKYVEKPMQTTNNITTTSNIPEKKYVSMTYIPHLSEILKKTFRKSIDNILFSFKTQNTNRKHLFSRLKDKPTTMERSYVIYSIPCEYGRKYIGRTKQKLINRIKQHKLKLKDMSQEATSLVSHARKTDHAFLFDHTEILDTARYNTHLVTMEMVYIHRHKSICVNHRNEGSALSQMYTGLL
ncbi:hypothetical protein DMENIID0001_077790 [Sergentomyia squamirostris]